MYVEESLSRAKKSDFSAGRKLWSGFFFFFYIETNRDAVKTIRNGARASRFIAFALLLDRWRISRANFCGRNRIRRNCRPRTIDSFREGVSTTLSRRGRFFFFFLIEITNFIDSPRHLLLYLCVWLFADIPLMKHIYG